MTFRRAGLLEERLRFTAKKRVEDDRQKELCVRDGVETD